MYKYQCQYENMVIDFHLEHLLHRIHTRLDARSRKGLMTN